MILLLKGNNILINISRSVDGYQSLISCYQVFDAPRMSASEEF